MQNDAPKHDCLKLYNYASAELGHSHAQTEKVETTKQMLPYTEIVWRWYLLNYNQISYTSEEKPLFGASLHLYTYLGHHKKCMPRNYLI